MVPTRATAVVPPPVLPVTPNSHVGAAQGFGEHVPAPPGVHAPSPVQSDCTVIVQTPSSQHGPRQGLGEQVPNCVHVPPEVPHAEEEVSEQLPSRQHAPEQGLGEQTVPVKSVPPAEPHSPGVRKKQKVPLQHGRGVAQRSRVQTPKACHVPPLAVQEANVTVVQVVPTQQGPVWASSCRLIVVAVKQTVRRTSLASGGSVRVKFVLHNKGVMAAVHKASRAEGRCNSCGR